MGKRSTEAATHEWDEERVTLRIRLKLTEERGISKAEHRALTERIAYLDRMISEKRGSLRLIGN